MTDNKKGTPPFESAPGNDTRNPTVEHARGTERERSLFLPLAWAELAREVKPQKFKGKTKRKSRAAAINAKRSQGGAALFDAVAWVAFDAVAWVAFDAVAWVAFGAWLATVALWLVEVIA